MTAFARYIGIDYSGAQTPDTSLSGLRAYRSNGSTQPEEASPPPSPRKYWTRRGIAKWLVEQLSGETATLVGIDNGFSFPLSYFEAHSLKLDWPNFLNDFQRHWPTDQQGAWVRDVRSGSVGSGSNRSGDSSRRRLVERRVRSAKSVFRFGVNGEVATSTHAGIPWIGFIRQRLGGRVHFWPFDGWHIPAGRSA